MAQVNLSTETADRLTDIENRLWLPRGCWKGWIGSLGLADANWCI